MICPVDYTMQTTANQSMANKGLSIVRYKLVVGTITAAKFKALVIRKITRVHVLHSRGLFAPGQAVQLLLNRHSCSDITPSVPFLATPQHVWAASRYCLHQTSLPMRKSLIS